MGLSAAAAYGSTWIGPNLPAELYRRNGKPVTGIRIHRDELPADEVQSVAGISVSTPARTAFDLGRRPGRTLAVVRVDALANATDLPPCELLDRGWRIVRVSADMLRYRRRVILGRTCTARQQAGAEWPVVARILADGAA